MKRPMRTMICWLTAALLAGGFPFRSEAKSYSSGGGHSYSSSSRSSSSGGSHSFSSGSSHSFSSGGGHSSSSGSPHSSSGGSTRSSSSGGSSGGSSRSSSVGSSSSSGGQSSSGSGSGSKDFASSSGKSYSSGSAWSDSDRHSYTSGKSYSSGSSHTFASSSRSDSTASAAKPVPRDNPDSSAPRVTFDTTAARARKEEASKEKFTQFKEPQLPPPNTPSDVQRSAADSASYRVKPPPLSPAGGSSYRPPVYVPDAGTLSTRTVRIYNVFNPYTSRPWVSYHDPYDSLFWWWLLDRSLEDRSWWAYHHRYDMDPARYQTLLATDQQLQARVEQLEAQQAPRDPNFVPAGLDRDLMYSDRYVTHAYSNRATPAGVLAFWVFAIPTALAVSAFFIWLIWFKRWQTAT